MRILSILSILAFLAACQREQVYSDQQLSAIFLNGVDRSSLQSLSYYSYGNHAGRNTVVRITAQPSVIASVLSGTKSWGRMTPRYAEEGQTCAESLFANRPPPKWYQLKADEPTECFRRAFQEITFYYRVQPDTLYVHHMEP